MPKSMNALNYDRSKLNYITEKSSEDKIYCDVNRVCEIEDMASVWYEAQYFL